VEASVGADAGDHVVAGGGFCVDGVVEEYVVAAYVVG